MRPGRLVNLDFTLLLCTVAATIIGVLMVYSATVSSHTGTFSLSDFATKQALFSVVGLAAMFVLARLDYRFLESFTLPFYLGTIFLLGLVVLIGDSNYGSQRWLDLKVIQLQPSELAKLGLVIILAKFLADRGREMHMLKWFVVAGVITLIPAAIV